MAIETRDYRSNALPQADLRPSSLTPTLSNRSDFVAGGLSSLSRGLLGLFEEKEDNFAIRHRRNLRSIEDDIRQKFNRWGEDDDTSFDAIKKAVGESYKQYFPGISDKRLGIHIQDTANRMRSDFESAMGRNTLRWALVNQDHNHEHWSGAAKGTVRNQRQHLGMDPESHRGAFPKGYQPPGTKTAAPERGGIDDVRYIQVGKAEILKLYADKNKKAQEELKKERGDKLSPDFKKFLKGQADKAQSFVGSVEQRMAGKEDAVKIYNADRPPKKGEVPEILETIKNKDVSVAQTKGETRVSVGASPLDTEATVKIPELEPETKKVLDNLIRWSDRNAADALELGKNLTDEDIPGLRETLGKMTWAQAREYLLPVMTVLDNADKIGSLKKILISSGIHFRPPVKRPGGGVGGVLDRILITMPKNMRAYYERRFGEDWRAKAGQAVIRAKIISAAGEGDKESIRAIRNVISHEMLTGGITPESAKELRTLMAGERTRSLQRTQLNIQEQKIETQARIEHHFQAAFEFWSRSLLEKDPAKAAQARSQAESQLKAALQSGTDMETAMKVFNVLQQMGIGRDKSKEKLIAPLAKLIPAYFNNEISWDEFRRAAYSILGSGAVDPAVVQSQIALIDSVLRRSEKAPLSRGEQTNVDAVGAGVDAGQTRGRQLFLNRFYQRLQTPVDNALKKAFPNMSSEERKQNAGQYADRALRLGVLGLALEGVAPEDMVLKGLVPAPGSQVVTPALMDKARTMLSKADISRKLGRQVTDAEMAHIRSIINKSIVPLVGAEAWNEYIGNEGLGPEKREAFKRRSPKTTFDTLKKGLKKGWNRGMQLLSDWFGDDEEEKTEKKDAN